MSEEPIRAIIENVIGDARLDFRFTYYADTKDLTIVVIAPHSDIPIVGCAFEHGSAELVYFCFPIYVAGKADKVIMHDGQTAATIPLDAHTTNCINHMISGWWESDDIPPEMHNGMDPVIVSKCTCRTLEVLQGFPKFLFGDTAPLKERVIC